MHAPAENLKARSALRTPGESLVWLCAMGLSLGLLMVVGLLAVIVMNGASVFWPRKVVQMRFAESSPAKFMESKTIAGEIAKKQEKMTQAGEPAALGDHAEEWQLYVGNKDVYGVNFVYVDRAAVAETTYPRDIMRVERMEYGDAIGYPQALLLQDGSRTPGGGPSFYQKFSSLVQDAKRLRGEIARIERKEIGAINAEIQSLRLDQRGLAEDSAEYQALEQKIAPLQARYEVLATQAGDLRAQQGEVKFVYELATGQEQTLAIGQVVGFYYPNQLSTLDRTGLFFHKAWNFLTQEPRESNTEGGIFPAIFGTVLMVFLMSFAVVPLGVLAAIYLREYAKQGFLVRLVRIAVNNLAGVPSIVFGVFGLGFFVYLVGGTHRPALLPEALPTPTFGTGGILWAALTLALLTVPVVIVAAEEGLAAVPRIVREGSLALGATKFETIWRVVLPAAAPGILTGMILAMARAAGEVAPLMIVGMVKLAPALPLDGSVALRPPRAQVHAPRLPHLRRRLPEPERGGHQAAGLRHRPAADPGGHAR